MYICWWCSGKLIWNRDVDASDFFYDENMEGICTHLRCSGCKAAVLYMPSEHAGKMSPSE